MPAGYLAAPNERLDSRGINIEPLADDHRIDFDFAVFKLDCCHCQSLLRDLPDCPFDLKNKQAFQSAFHHDGFQPAYSLLI